MTKDLEQILRFLDCRLGGIQNYLLLSVAAQVSKDSKAAGGSTVQVTTPNTVLLHQNSLETPVFVHIRAKLPSSPTPPVLYVGPTEASVFNTDAAPYALFDGDVDTFALEPGKSLWGFVTGPNDGTTVVIPVGISPLLDSYRMLQRLMGVIQK